MPPAHLKPLEELGCPAPGRSQELGEAGPRSDPAPRPVQAPPLPAWAARLRTKEAGSPLAVDHRLRGAVGVPSSSAPEPQARGRSPGEGCRRRPSPATPPGLRARRAPCPWVGSEGSLRGARPQAPPPKGGSGPADAAEHPHTPSLASRAGPPLPFGLPGAASRAPLRDAAVTHSDTLQLQ